MTRAPGTRDQFAIYLDCSDKHIVCLVKFSEDYALKYFLQKIGFDISCSLSPLEAVCMKCQVLFGDNVHEMSNSVFWEK